jgi:acetate kinase
MLGIARHGLKLRSSPLHLLFQPYYSDHKRGIKTLTLNAGSTTLKYSLYDVTRKGLVVTGGGGGLDAVMIASGLVDKVGSVGCITHNKSTVVDNQLIPTHTEGLTMLLDILKEKENIDVHEIACVGHRVVHGGATFSKPTIVTPDVLDEIRNLSSLAPLHNPAAVAGIEASGSLFPSAVQVAVFDTAFHTATMPPSSYRYAIPKQWYEEYGIRRYGFHGTSYSFVTDAVGKFLGKKISDMNLIVMHLGGGASMCCIKNGQSIDTTMGLTPLEGLVMATRSGDLDPGVYGYLSKNGLTEDEVYSALNKKSGILGLTGGISSDMRVVRDKALEGNADCRLARAVFAERWYVQRTFSISSLCCFDQICFHLCRVLSIILQSQVPRIVLHQVGRERRCHRVHRRYWRRGCCNAPGYFGRT